MTFRSHSDSPSIFRDGKLKLGFYKIQNLYSQTYLDIHEHSKELCCRPAQNLEEGRGPLGAGYSIQRVAPGEPEQFCTPMDGTANCCPISVAAYPAAWRTEIANDDKHRGFECIRFYWGTKKIVIDLQGDHNDDGAAVIIYHETSNPWQIWKPVPVKVEDAATPGCPSYGIPEPGSLPLYEGVAQQSAHTERTESERGDFSTIVTEVTIVTTRKRYRVEGA